MTQYSRNGKVTRDQLLHAVDGELEAIRACGDDDELVPDEQEERSRELKRAQHGMIGVLVDIHLGTVKDGTDSRRFKSAQRALEAEYGNSRPAAQFQELVEGIIGDICEPVVEIKPAPRKTTVRITREGYLSKSPDQQVDKEKISAIMTAVVAAYWAHTKATPDAEVSARVEKWMHQHLHDRVPLRDPKNIADRARTIALMHELVNLKDFKLTHLPDYRRLLKAAAPTPEHAPSDLRAGSVAEVPASDGHTVG